MIRTKRKGVDSASEQNRLFNEANEAWDRGDLRKAFDLFTRASELGDVSSQLDLGYFYDQGLAVKKDKQQAMKWYRKAYVQGDAGAANNIGTIYRDLGETKKMLWWFRRAAAMGDPDILLDLGKRYETGMAVPRDMAKARRFYQRVISSKHATEDGKAEAKRRLLALRDVRQHRPVAVRLSQGKRWNHRLHSSI